MSRKQSDRVTTLRLSIFRRTNDIWRFDRRYPATPPGYHLANGSYA
jgi:hypothetical protein